ncbi:MAG: type II glyceraldehyde-3-phosphate dehydrogenase [Candidatus Hodarchaeales archaeon]|jgi:glyceraldehyde-3-phosphate dehydrogenase (NAD(P))
MTKKTKVGIVGYGIIGKRVTDAIVLQNDMELTGIADIISDYRLRVAVEKNYDIYCSVDDFRPMMERAGYKIKGNLPEFLSNCDIVVDCTPSGVPAKNKIFYELKDIPFIVQGGEKHGLTGLSFSTLGNYTDAIGSKAARVVSCNTTGLTRALSPIVRDFGIEDVFVALCRRSADPSRTNRGPINGAVPVLGISHHGPDVETVVHALKGKIHSLAIAVSMTLSHVHMIRVKLEDKTTTEEVLESWRKTPRVIVDSGKRGFYDTAQIMEYYRDLGRPRYDRPELFIWEETVHVDKENNLSFIQDVHQESIAIPENVDCIRAMLKMEKNPLKCMEKTDKAMNIYKNKDCYDYKGKNRIQSVVTSETNDIASSS